MFGFARTPLALAPASVPRLGTVATDPLSAVPASFAPPSYAAVLPFHSHPGAVPLV